MILFRNSSVKLVIYNALGSEISVLVNENQNPGNYTVEWNAAGYPSGIYFYILSAGTFTGIKKMTLLK
ncbi:MAG: T9SS type A sorting domain-containing protein [Ignavibacteria bacterium]|nr:T9SS type A sorting domain-containing protein [Ignavibacteria bacterium]